MNREELLQQINYWHEKNKHKKIIDAIEALPREEWGYELTCLLARACNNLYSPSNPGLEKAVSLLESVREDGKDDPHWHFRMGYALFYLFRKAEALTYFRKAFELDPDHPNVPFFGVNHADSASVSLNVGEYLQDVFDTRTEEDFEGSGYDWESLANVFLKERMPDLTEKVKFDSESSMFCAYSEDMAALREFIVGFKNACEDKALILDLFSRAELD